MTTVPAETEPAETEPAEFDVVVAGSGAAGMTAALTAADLGLSVVVVEKAGSFGGSTARSGGGIWAPGNGVLRAAGVTDTPDQARTYLAHVAGADVPAGLREAFLEHGPAMLDLVLARTPLRLAWVPDYADYYPEAPGGLARGRSVEPVPMDSRRLGAELARLARPYLPTPAGVAITQADYRWLSLGPRHPRAILAGARVAGRAARGRVTGHRMLSLGQALAAGLRAGLLGGGGAREHRRRDPGRPGPGRGDRADGRRLVGAVDRAARRPVLLPGRTQPARLPPGQRGGPAIRQRVGPVRRRGARHVRREHPGEPAHPGLAGLRPAVPRPVRVRGPAAGPGAATPVVRGRVGGPRRRPGRAGPGGGRRRGRPGQDRDQVQRLRRGGAGRGVRPGRVGVRPVLRRPARPAQPEPGRAGPAAVLRGQDRARRPGHQGRATHRLPRPGVARGRHPDPGAVRGGQRERIGDGPQLRGRGRHDRAGHDVRLHRRPRHGGRRSQDRDRMRPLVGTPVPAVTRTGPSPGTWLTAVPRIWRTASAMPFMPWM